MISEVLWRFGRRSASMVVIAALATVLAACGGDNGVTDPDGSTPPSGSTPDGGGGSTDPSPGDGPGTDPSTSGETEPVIDMTGVRKTQAGAARIGTAAYEVPAGAIFVSPTGSDSAAGTLAAPYATLKRAVDRAPPGATIVMRAGSYHEELALAKKLTFQPYPQEAVWLDGSSVVGGWTRSGSVWVTNWDHKFSSDPTYTRGAPDGAEHGWRFLDPAYPMAAHPDQVWIDGVAQIQVASQSDVEAGSFFYDENAAKLYLGSDPAGRVVRASDLQKAIVVGAGGAGSIFRGFGVRRYAPSVPDMGAVATYAGTHVVFEQMAIVDNATAGLHINAADVQILNVTLARNGQLGAGANRADRLRVRGLLSAQNNLEHFKTAPVSGAFKLAHSRDVEVRDSVFLANLGQGLWFDESCYDMKVFSNDAIGNVAHGMVFEISAKALVADNLVRSNGGHGIHVDGTSDVEVWNNTLADNGALSKGRNLNLVMGTRRWANVNEPGRDAREPIPPNMTWITRPVKVRNNAISGGGGNCLVCVEDYSHEFTAEELQISTDRNIYQRASASTPTWFAVWSRGKIHINPFVYNTLGAFSAATGQETHGRLFEGTPVLDANYRPVAAVSAAVDTIAEPLAQEVAVRIGRPAGTRHLGAWFD